MKTKKRVSRSVKSGTRRRKQLIARKARLLRTKKLRQHKAKRQLVKGGKRRHQRLGVVRRKRKRRWVNPVLPAPVEQSALPQAPDAAYTEGYDEAYNEGFNAGFAKGYEDGHQLAYQSK
ncbi:hypothetical protein [Paenibacillus dokdonensis]|uniref:hypothetical protein n=1 Tax=Paenibacillus dokdonensis TaxID=2567944 RepID=UPI0010A88209|nr:hypothetical protein [Paenibacillus dokdonensis]